MSGKRLIYWDSCCFIAWLCKKNNRTKEEMAGLDEVASDFMKGNCIIMTSSIYKTEVLAKGEEIKKLNNFTKRKNFQSVQVSDGIVDRSQKIREHYNWMSTPDALHLATAIIYKADVFQTFDGATGSSHSKLLKINGEAAIESLRIVVPCLPQQTLGL